MLRIFIFLLPIFTLLPVKAQQLVPGTPSDRKEYKKKMEQISLAGVAQRSDWKFRSTNGIISTIRFKAGEVRYDKNGAITETSTFNEQGDRNSIVVFEYNPNYLLLSETEFTNRGELIGKTKYTYNDEEYLSEIILYNSSEYIISKTICEPDKENNIFTRRIMFSPDSIKKKIVSFYSDLTDGFVTQEWTYTGESNLKYKKEIRRNEKGKVETEIFTTAQGQQLYYLKYTYNLEGNLSTIERYYPSGVKVKSYDFNFAPSGLISGEIKYNENGEIIHYYKYTYN